MFGGLICGVPTKLNAKHGLLLLGWFIICGSFYF